MHTRYGVRARGANRLPRESSASSPLAGAHGFGGEGHPQQHVVELPALVGIERRQQVLLRALGELPALSERGVTELGDVQRVRAAIARVAPALHQPRAFELVDR